MATKQSHEDYRDYTRRMTESSACYRDTLTNDESPANGWKLLSEPGKQCPEVSVTILAGAGEMTIADIVSLTTGDTLKCHFAEGHEFSLVSGGVILFNLKLCQLTQSGAEFEVAAIGEKENVNFT
ncbi:MAG: hypothetical protein PHC51_13380 [bacterium]|nr:hypothetical protein [bacterium]